jgi:hypothetical protein
VLLYHAPGLYSLVAHLGPGTLKVRQGQLVRRGEPLGLCGSSGRSPVPHLHFQLQATARIGAPTVPLELHDVVTEEAPDEQDEQGGTAQPRPRLHRALVPREGQALRNLQPAEDLEQRLRLPYGEALAFARPGEQAVEQLTPEIDLLGNLLLRSDDGRSLLYYDRQSTHLTVYDTLGRRGSALQLIHAALARVPFEADERLVWDDVLPRRVALPRWLWPLHDLLAPFSGDGGVELTYRARREGAALLIEGRSRRSVRGAPLVQTTARLDARGIERVALTVRGVTREVRRAEAN